MTDETNNSLKLAQLISALQDIEHCADWDAVDISTQAEVAPSKVMGSSHRPTGRELLVIVVPYVRNKQFLRSQRERMQREIAHLQESIEFLKDSINNIDEELASE